ncbi:DUF6838 family protein [Lachnospiraceae bacterium 38-10]
MINSIIEAISRAIRKEFGSRYTNYMEEVKQDLRKPCFFILCVNPTSKLFLRKRYLRTNQFCIQYFPESRNDKRRECNDTAERLMSCLKWISISGKPAIGTKMEYEIVDGILHFFVNYDMYVFEKSDPLPRMENLKEKIREKG